MTSLSYNMVTLAWARYHKADCGPLRLTATQSSHLPLTPQSRHVAFLFLLLYSWRHFYHVASAWRQGCTTCMPSSPDATVIAYPDRLCLRPPVRAREAALQIRAESYHDLNWVIFWLHCQTPASMGSAPRAAGPVSVYCDWINYQAWYAGSIPLMRQVQLFLQINN